MTKKPKTSHRPQCFCHYDIIPTYCFQAQQDENVSEKTLKIKEKLQVSETAISNKDKQIICEAGLNDLEKNIISKELPKLVKPNLENLTMNETVAACLETEKYKNIPDTTQLNLINVSAIF